MQLTLDIDIPEQASFENFCWHGNELLESQIKNTLPEKGSDFFYIWGTPGSGRSHLLQAITQASEFSSVYLPLKQLLHFGTDALEGIENLDLICIDDIDAICQNHAFEEALFHLYNKIRDANGKQLYISGEKAPHTLDIALPDLKSRLSWGSIFQLKELDEVDKINILQLHAKAKGLTLEQGCAEFLLKRCSRNMHDLTNIIRQLDKASLAAKRKLTIPFIKQTLGI